jgi:hypothetical protein
MNLDNNQKIMITLGDEILENDLVKKSRKYLDILDSKKKELIKSLVKKGFLERIWFEDQDMIVQTDKVLLEHIDVELAKKLDLPCYHKFWSEIEKIEPTNVTITSASVGDILKEKMKK